MKTWTPIVASAGMILGAAGLTPPASAQLASEFPPEMAAEVGDERVVQGVLRLVGRLSEIPDWEAEHAAVMSALENIYARNGWTSESDRFSLELVHEVEALPPFAIAQRFDTLVGMISDRYLLDERQEASLRRTLIREGAGLFARNLGRIMQYAPELIETRARGEPFTPEQVARWARLADPVLQDAKGTLNRSAEAFLAELNPDQQDLVRIDLDAANRRVRGVEEQARRWMHGEWTAVDWGLEADPIQASGAAPTASGGAATPPASAIDDPQAARSVMDGRGERSSAPDGAMQRQSAGGRSAAVRATRPGAPDAPADPWADLVREYIRRYSLGSDQQQSAWRIHEGLARRRDEARQRCEAQLAPLRRQAAESRGEGAKAKAERVEAARDAEIDRLLEQLKRRLERLPTRAQRAAAKG